MKESRTASIERVPSGPPCWRLIIWKHVPHERTAQVWRVDHYEAIDVSDTTSSIEDVFETDLKSYHILRKMARDRGFEAPTFIYVQRMLRKALGPHDNDDGSTVGNQIVYLWNVLDDCMERTTQLKITLSEIGCDSNQRKILLTRLSDYEERQIG